jgi:DNA-directed RNA polymerase II subunit RPB1
MEPVSKIIGIQFGLMSPAEIFHRSVAEITTKDTYSSNKPVPNGLFDPRMGTLEPGTRCLTDQLDYIKCPGYFGHIELARPVFYLQYMDTIMNIAKCICIKCSRILLDKDKYASLLSLPSDKRWKQVLHICNKSIHTCGESKVGCGCRQPTRLKLVGASSVIAEWTAKDKDGTASSVKMTPEMFIKLFTSISDEDVAFMGFSPIWSRPEWMICTTMAVPPPSMRPSVRYEASQRSEDDLTYILVQVIRANKMLQDKMENPATPLTVLEDHHNVLQYFVASLVDNKIKNGKPVAQRTTSRAFKSVKERLNGKTGRVRGNLMGKRVDFSARSVITPDPNLSIRELGVPLKIAMNITKPVTVNRDNLAMLSLLILNGPETYPGAKLYERNMNGTSVHVSLKHADRSLIHLQYGDIVHRHMMDGDVVLFNRQPTLHRMSMMGHIARIMYIGDTFRMNVGDTKPYNADFDGDEMNLHMPQTIEAETELRLLAAVPYQIVSPASNQPIIGIFQDSLIGAFLFTRKLLHFEPKFAMSLLSNIPNIDMTVLDKTKPVSNFDILSMILPPMSCLQKNKMFADGDDLTTSNHVIEIVNGKYIRGMMDKGVLGATCHGIIHRLYTDFGNMAASDFIDNLQYIVTEYMKIHSFSVGVSDLNLVATTLDSMASTLEDKFRDVGELIAKTHFNTFVNESGQDNAVELESQILTILAEANTAVGTLGKKGLCKNNRFVHMVNAGSKGSDVNISQMVACLGQQQIDGKRCPYGLDDRTLPHFTKYNDMPNARGFVSSSFRHGLSPTEFFFHAQGGRIGLIDTAVKTATTGYIQRRCVKAMEDLYSSYDGSVRNNKNKITQLCYGDDNIDPTKVVSYKMILCGMKLEQIYDRFCIEHSSTSDKTISKQWVDFMILSRDRLIQYVFEYTNDYNVRVPVGIPQLIGNVYHSDHLCDNENVLTVVELYHILDHYFSLLTALKCYGPTELFKIYYYFTMAPKEMIVHKKFSAKSLHTLLQQIVTHYKRALINPGEMVGIIAAQSIGEPTTQMTLNTFHFAGVASKSNVTRGVPRIEEILNIAESPKNPSCTVWLKEFDESDRARAMYYMHRLSFTTIKDLALKCEIVFDPTGMEAAHVATRDAEFDTLLLQCGTVHKSDSNWSVVVYMNKLELLNRHISMDDISFCIANTRDLAFVQCLTSDENDDTLCIWVKPTPQMNQKKVFHDMDYLFTLKDLQNKLLNVVVRGVKHIEKVNIRKVLDHVTKINGNYETKELWVLDTVGTNLIALLGLDYIDSSKTTSNDIREMCSVLGIEAARQCIYSELTEVIEFDGAYINEHHKMLLVDRMTSTTPMMSIGRHGVNKDDIGPIAKASFEETPEMFFRAALHGELDNMRGVSANVMTGQEGYYGTSSFNVLLDMVAVKTVKAKASNAGVSDIIFTENTCKSMIIADQVNIQNMLHELFQGPPRFCTDTYEIKR